MLTDNLCMCSPTFIRQQPLAHGDNMFVCCCYFIFAHRCCDLFREGGSSRRGTVVSTPPFSFQNGGIQPNVDPWTLLACPLFVSLWVLKTKELKVTPGRVLSVRAHTHAIDCLGMHLQRLNRVTSSASCSVLKLSTPEPCATYQDIYMILGVLC